MKVLVTGISGKLGRLVANRLLKGGHKVIGVDRRPWAGAPEGVKIVEADIRKRPAEDVFRTEQPDAVVHMATVTHLMHRSPDRFRINLQGTRAVVAACERYGVKQMIFVGRHTYYGAQPDSPLYHTEDEPPMGVHSFPELADLVAADLFAGSVEPVNGLLTLGQPEPPTVLESHGVPSVFGGHGFGIDHDVGGGSISRD